MINPTHQQHLIKGIVAMLVSALSFTLMGFMVKLSGDLPIIQKSIFHNVVAMVVSGYFIYRHQSRFLGLTSNWIILILRSIFGLLGILFSFYAIDHLLLSDADMLGKMAPFFLIALSALFLQEKVYLAQLLICLLSFLGVLFIIKPTFNVNTFPYLVGLLGSLVAAFSYLMLRILALRSPPEKPDTIIFFFSSFCTLMLLPFVWWNFHPMSQTQILYLLLSGIFAAIGQFGITWAYHYAQATDVSIYSYSSVIFAALFSMIGFNQYPDGLSWLGYFIIFISGGWLFLFNRKK